MTRDRFATRLALVALGGLVLRVAYVLVARHDAVVGGDAVAYHNGANLLADGHGFIDPIRFELAGVERESAAHPPLYTVYLAAWSLVGLDGPLAHRLASTLLGAATVVLVGVLGRYLAGDRAGLLAAGFAAVYPHLWLNDGALLSESAAAPAVALALVTVERYRRRPDVARAAQLGAAVAVAALVRAELALLLALLVVPLVVARTSGGIRLASRAVRAAVARQLAAAGLAAVVLLGPWIGYNLARFEEPVTLSNGLGATMLGGSCDAAFHGEKLGYWSERCPTVEQPGWEAPTDPTREEVRAFLRSYVLAEPDESERDVASRELAIEYIRDNSSRYPVVVAARIGRLWNVYRPGQNARFDADIEGRGAAGSWLALASYYALVALAGAGLVALRCRRHPIWPFVVLAGVVTLSAAITFGIQRYRVPVDVALTALAAVGVDAWLRRRSRRGAPDASDPTSADAQPVLT